MGFRVRDVEGRTHRLGFFGYWLLTFVTVAVVVTALNVMFFPNALDSPAGILAILGYFIVIPAAIRRLHDIGWSGWWAILLFVPFVFAVMVLILFFWPGQKGENKYGPSPIRAREVSEQPA